jgi:hypothetical protein
MSFYYNTIGIREEYYDMRTARIMQRYMTDLDREMMKRCDLDRYELLLSRWKLMVLHMPKCYRREYYSLKTQEERNVWFKTFLNISINMGINRMPLTLLPFI